MMVGASTAGAFLLDHASKSLVERSLDEGERPDGMLEPYVVRRPSRGPHATVGIAAGTALALGIAGVGTTLGRPPLLLVGAGMVAGGMLGNLTDRITGDGSVTDFLATPLGLVNGGDVLIGAGIAIGALGIAIR